MRASLIPLSMNKVIHLFSFLVAISASLSVARGALIISDSDILNNHYTYSLDYADTSSSTKFNNDVYQNDQVSVIQEGSGTHIVLPSINFNFRSSSSFTYRFDFSTTNYLPVAVAFAENFFAGASNDPPVIISSSYSVDNGSNWVSLTSISSPNSGATSYTGTKSLNLGSHPETVLYKVDFIATASGFGWGNNAQWNRLAGAEDTYFVADFTTAAVPEPSALTLIGCSALLMVILRRRSSARRISPALVP